MGRMPRALGRCCRVGMLLPRAFLVQEGAGCILHSQHNKSLHSPGSGGIAESSLPEKKAGSIPKAQNKSLRPTAFLKQKQKQDGKI